MDDIIIFDHSKKFLHGLRCKISLYLEERLKLTLKENWAIFSTYVRGVDFVGYRSFDNYTLLRKRTKKRFCKEMKRLRKKQRRGYPLSKSDRSVIGSYKGILQWADCGKLKDKLIK